MLSGITNNEEFPHLFALREELRSWKLLQLDPALLRRTSPGDAADVLEPDGSNLAAALVAIKTETATPEQPRGALALISRQLASLVSEVDGVDADYNRRSLPDGSRRVTKVEEATRQAWGGWTLPLVHADGGGDARTKRREQVEPVLEACLQAPESRDAAARSAVAGCAIVPIREMEAWALADREALGLAMGEQEPGEDSGEPPRRARLVERIEDPKAMLDTFIQRRDGSFGRRGEDMKSIALEDLGSQIPLDRLRDVPSFRELEKELLESLARLRLIANPGEK